VREAFFRSGAQMPEVRLTLTPGELDATSTRFTLEIDGQMFEYRHGPERNWPAVWPGPNPGTAAATFEVRAGGRPNLAFDGPWAFFRMVDAGQLRRDSELRYTLTLQAGGQQARLRIEATSVLNPFARSEWRQFRCGIS
jgi:type VI secretion system protein ImpL